MPDIRIVSSATLRETVADWLLLPDGTLDESQELANYVKVALMSDRLADQSEILPFTPDSDYDRRGWWADMDADIVWNGWPIGTKNWLLERAKISDQYSAEGDTVVRAQTYTQEALQPLITHGICTSIDVQAARTGIDRIDVAVVIYRGNQPAVALIFQDLWNALTVEPIDMPYGIPGNT